MVATCSSSEPYGCCSSTGDKSRKNLGEMGDARMLRQRNEKDDCRLCLLLVLPQRGSMPRFARFLRRRQHTTVTAATRTTRAADPAAIPAIAAVLSCTAELCAGLFTVDGSTIAMTLLEKTEPLRPRRAVVFGRCSQPASKATKAILCKPALSMVRYP